MDSKSHVKTNLDLLLPMKNEHETITLKTKATEKKKTKTKTKTKTKQKQISKHKNTLGEAQPRNSETEKMTTFGRKKNKTQNDYWPPKTL
jgi:hypothetical protein